MDRIARSLTPKGSIAYEYYANGRRKSLKLPNQPSLNYFYDAGNRPTSLTLQPGTINNFKAQNIEFEYDGANRRVQVHYPNGISRTNAYDAAGQLVSIKYSPADGNGVGELIYSYDPDGRRLEMGGTLARTALPGEIETAEHTGSNALAKFGASTLTYDLNGNLLSDGRQIYTWNARDQLVHIKTNNGDWVASFTYDGMACRQTKTVRGASHGYVYDEFNVVQELNGLATDNRNPINIRSNYLTGNIDEVFLQLSGVGNASKIVNYLHDAQGSAIRLTDEDGRKLVDYSYGVYGKTVADAAVTNPFQYAGRENDETGLYYYRSRYYSPETGRFISRDPVGLEAGDNDYAYVDGDPISLTDPYGLLPGLGGVGQGDNGLTCGPPDPCKYCSKLRRAARAICLILCLIEDHRPPRDAPINPPPIKPVPGPGPNPPPPPGPPKPKPKPKPFLGEAIKHATSYFFS